MCKRLSCQILLVLLLALESVIAQADIASDLLGYWPLDGNAEDSSGNGHHGEAFGDPSFVDGIMGQGMECLGEQSVYIDDFAAIQGLDATTICMWVLPNKGSGDQVLWFVDEDGSYGRVRLRIEGDHWEFRHGDGSGNPNIDSDLVVGEWTHLAGVRENGVRLELFINGASVGETDFASAGVAEAQAAIGTERRSPTSIRQAFEGLIDEVRLYARALSAADIKELFAYRGFLPVRARNPQPAGEAIDVPRDVVLTWTPGTYAQTHDIYLGTEFEDVNNASLTQGDALVSQGQDANTLDAGLLEFGQTYYWRVDEVNGAPDNTVFKGEVWSFVAEPLSYPLLDVTATASGSSAADMGPEKTIDGSGLNDMDQHSREADDMWLSDAGVQPTWIQYEFDRAHKLHEMWVWNSNQGIEPFVGLGAKDVAIETSLDGTAWTLLEDATQFAQATGTVSYTANTVIDFGGATAKFVRITINAGWGMMPQYGLSEVRFFSIPTKAREPKPAAGASIDGVDVVLSWRAGREAASHDVSLGTDRAAVADGAAVIATTTEARLDPGALDYGTTYFWRVDEINEDGTPTTYPGDVWSLTTPAYGIIDNFDQYDDNCNRIFFAWQDGLGHSGGENVEGCDEPASNGNGGGSIVGNNEAPFAEKAIVTAGSRQSLPFNYDNSFGPSEATLSIPGQDWTASGVQTLSLAFYGTAGNTGTLYVKINNTKVSYDLDPGDIARTAWQAWNIDLTGLGGLQNVNKLTIGVDGASAAGMLYIDDIRLYPQSGDLVTPAEPDDADLLTYLSFDEGAGAIAGDSSGNGHDGTLVGPPQWAAGKVGGALQFGNGSHVLDDDAEDYVNGLSAITITMWIKSDVVDTDSGLIIFEEPTGNDQRGMRYDADGGEGDINLLKYGMAYTSGTEEDESPANLQTTEWQHVAVTSASGAGLALYINGTLTLPEEDAGAVTGVIEGCTTLIVGKGGKDEVNSAGWDGLIDELRIYGRALSAGEIMWLAGRTESVYKPL